MPERTPPGAANPHYFPANPSNPLVQQALRYNRLTAVPSNWVIDSSGQLLLLGPDGTPGPRVPVDEPTKASFLNELAHAAPYIAAAFAMGVGGEILAGWGGGAAGSGAAAGSASGGGAAAGGVEAGVTAGVSPFIGSGAVGLSTMPTMATALGYGAGAGAGGAFDAAGNFIGSSTFSGAGGGGFGWGSLITNVAPTLANDIFGYFANSRAADGSKYAADLQFKSVQDALAYTAYKDALLRHDTLDSQKFSYDQWAAREQNLGPYRSIGQGAAHKMAELLGIPEVTFQTPPLPDYLKAPNPTPTPPPFLAGVTGSSSGSGSRNGGTSSGGAATGNPTDPNYITQQLQDLYKRLGATPTGRGTGPTDIAYFADQVAKTGGWQGDNAGYWTTRIQQELSGNSPEKSAGARSTSVASPSLGFTPPPVINNTQPTMGALLAPAPNTVLLAPALPTPMLRTFAMRNLL